jgi:hypothetical protein
VFYFSNPSTHCSARLLFPVYAYTSRETDTFLLILPDETEEFVESAIAHKENGEEIPSDVLAAFDNTPDFVKAFVQDAPLEMWQTIETGDDGAIVPAVHIMNQSEKTMREFVVGPETRDFGR